MDNNLLKNLTNIKSTTISLRNNITQNLEDTHIDELHKNYPNMSAYDIMKYKMFEVIHYEEKIIFYCNEGYMFSSNGTEVSYICTTSGVLDTAFGSIFGCIGL